MTNHRPYYTLATRHTDGKFYVQFGDHNPQVVRRERLDSFADVRLSDWTIFRTESDSQVDIQMYIDENLNQPDPLHGPYNEGEIA